MARAQILDPVERLSEIVFGLIVVLSFTGALSVAAAGHSEVHQMMVGAILCNLAWGIIDAAFYVIACFAERRHKADLLRKLQQCADPAEVRNKIEEVLPERIIEALEPPDFGRIHSHLKQVTLPSHTLHLCRRDWLGALAVLLLVFLSTLPVVLPFVFVRSARLALHISNVIAIGLLFASGQMLARYAGLHRCATGLVMVLIGGALVAITIALGG